MGDGETGQRRGGLGDVRSHAAALALVYPIGYVGGGMLILSYQSISQEYNLYKSSDI